MRFCISALGLAEDFGFADHHRIKSCRDAKKMPRAFRVFLAIECFQIVFRARSAFDAQGLRDFFIRNICIRRRINFHPITSREQQHFAAAEITQQCGRSGVTSEAFTRFNRRSAMIETKAKKVHAR
jgi:hypothetical protein